MTAAGPSLSPSWRHQKRRNTSLYISAWLGLPFLAIRKKRRKKKKAKMSQTANLSMEQNGSLLFSKPKHPVYNLLGSGEGTTAWNTGKAPAHPHRISPPCKLTETPQGNVDLRSPRDRPQSTKLKHPSPVKQAW